MEGVAPEPSSRFWRHVSFGEMWLTVTMWAWGPACRYVDWTMRQAPEYGDWNNLIVLILIIGTIGAPFALLGVAIHLSRSFAMPVILRLAAHALIMVAAWGLPPVPLRPEQEWQAKRASLQKLAAQALASKSQVASNGPWKASAYKGQVTLSMHGYDSYCIAYATRHTLDLDQYMNASGPTVYLDKVLDRDWFLLRIETTL